MRTITGSIDAPQRAPAGFRELPPRVVLHDGQGLFETWHGSGVPHAATCGHCGNADDNLAIFGSWGFSYPNGRSWDEVEIVCGACGRFTLLRDLDEDV